MNNFMVAERFISEENAELDETLKYIFTFKMQPKKVVMRLLRSSKSDNMYLLIAPEKD